MKLENKNDVLILQEGNSVESINMSLDMDSANILMNILSKNLYSDPIGSTVRETASNALDSHRNSGTTEAIIVSLKVNNQNNYEFSVEDFGLGMDNDDVENIISKYGKSTKRLSNNELGMFGLGFKSPLAYSSAFYFVCRKNGVERKYILSEGEDVNTIDLLYETPTEERNGVKIIVPIKFQDRFTFKNKINEQLAYFESVYFDVNVQNEIITNEFNIHRSEHFQISEMNTDLSIHICLDNVYYPLDFAKLGIPIISLPIGLRFSLTDGLYPTPNREQLIYSSQAKATILKKLEIVSEYFVDKYNEHNIDCDSVKSIFEYYSSSNRNVTIGNTVIDVSKFPMTIGKKFKKPEYKKFPLTDFQLLYRHKDYMFYEYRLSLEFYRGTFRQVKGYYSGSLDYNDITNSKKIYEYDEWFVGNKKSYIKSLLPVNSYDTIKFVKKAKKLTLVNKDRNHAYGSYIDILDLRKYPKSSWRARIVEFQTIVKELTSKIEFVDDIKIPQAWLDARKKKRVSMGSGTKRVKLQGEINCKQATDLQRYVSGKSSKLVPTVMKVENIESSKCLIVYGKQEHESLADQLYSVSDKQKIKYLILSDREHKVAQTLDFHNFIPIEKFMEGKNKPFKRIITGYLIHVLQEKYNDTFSKKEVFRFISQSLYSELVNLQNYHKANYHRIGDEDVYKAMLVIAEEHKLFDETIYTEYKRIKDLLDNFPFIETTMEIFPYSHYNPIKEEHKNILSDLFKYYKIRINYTNYKLVLNEDITEPLTEEIIEELTQNN